MAADTSRVRARLVIVIVQVTLRALHGRMRAGQRKPGRRVIKSRARPRRRVVTLSTGLREAGLHVIRIRRALEVFQVAADAGGIRAGQVVVVVDVTLGARNRRVRARQRETCG